MLFVFPATLIRVVDGDTLRLTLDLGFHIRRLDQPYRLLRIDAPEMNTEAGKAAKGWLEMFLIEKPLTAQTFKSDSFGRFLIEAWANGENVADALVSAGHAAYRSY